MPSADLGGKNPHATLHVSMGLPDGDPNAHPGMPYRMLDAYGRDLSPKSHRVAILESDRLRAIFLLDLGGRLWSLVHKPTGRELLYVNPVFQPANFAIRNAWISGGVEWNAGIFGHSAFTCSPVFAARTFTKQGDGFRIWEYERKRGVVWQVDFHAPDGCDYLLWSPRIVNPHDQAIPMYWWTCIAVSEEPDGRVLAPTDFALEPDHNRGGERTRKSLVEQPDLSFPQKRDLPHDTYFEIPDGERPWVAHVSGDGNGVVHVSSDILFGRKQWVWGMEPGGRRWQHWLCPEDRPYIEIQGGLTRMQHQYAPMPARTTWTWLEAFGPLTSIDNRDWTPAVAAVKQVLGRDWPEPEFARWEREMADIVRTPHGEMLSLGSGWGAVETMRRRHCGESALSDEAISFAEESIGVDERVWADLLRTKKFTQSDSAPTPGGYVGPEWRPILEEASEDCGAQLHLGVIAYQEGDLDQARRAWDASLPNGWAHRNLAALDRQQGHLEQACEQILLAQTLLPSEPHIADEACRLLLEAAAFDKLATLIDGMTPAIRRLPRARLACAQLDLHAGRLDRVAAYFRAPFDIVDLREAETTAYDLWRELCRLDPEQGDPASPPTEWDFRMRR